MTRPPVGMIGRAVGGPMKGQYVRLIDDRPGGIYVFWSQGPDFSGEGWDNWFENWDEVEAFFAQTVGTVDWLDGD